MTDEIASLYRERFETAGLERRRAVWRTLNSAFFAGLIGPDKDILELAAGYGEFIATVPARRKIAVDVNPDSASRLPAEVEFFNRSATDLTFLEDGTIDVVFASNFLEHLRSKEELTQVFQEVRRVLREGGRFIILGPNIRFAYREYWDFYDHHLALSDRSLSEGLVAAGFELERVIPRFLPFTMAGNQPTWPLLVRGYLALPLAWRVLGKQFLVIAKR